MKEYKLSTGWAIFMYVFVAAMYIGAAWLIIFPFTSHDAGSYNKLIWSIPLALVIIVSATYVLLEIIRGRLIIDEDRVYTISVTGGRSLSFTEIAGYRIGEKNQVYIIPKSKGMKKIEVSPYLERNYEIMQWLKGNFTDLDLLDVNTELEVILESNEYGGSVAEREANLAKAKNIARIVNIAGIGITFWAIFFPRPYIIPVSAAAMFPVLCIVILIPFKGLLRISEGKNSAYPSVLPGFLATTLAVTLRGLLDFDLYTHAGIWVYVATVVFCFLLLLSAVIKTGGNNADGMSILIGIGILVFGYGYGAAVIANCYFDESAPVEYRPIVLSKRISKSKHTTYYLRLSTWGPKTESDDVSVTQSLYENINPADTVTVYFRRGKLNVPWFAVGY